MVQWVRARAVEISDGKLKAVPDPQGPLCLPVYPNTNEINVEIFLLTYERGQRAIDRLWDLFGQYVL